MAWLSPTLFRHFIDEARGQAGSVYGRHMYEVMRYWDDDHPEWDVEEHAFAAAWRNQIHHSRIEVHGARYPEQQKMVGR